MASPEKNQLVEQHLSLVQAIARKVKKTLGTSIEYDDLVAYGSKGLVEAADRFDARPGVAFTTFAYYRIRGAMFDGLRTMGWYSRADYACNIELSRVLALRPISRTSSNSSVFHGYRMGRSVTRRNTRRHQALHSSIRCRYELTHADGTHASPRAARRD